MTSTTSTTQRQVSPGAPVKASGVLHEPKQAATTSRIFARTQDVLVPSAPTTAPTDPQRTEHFTAKYDPRGAVTVYRAFERILVNADKLDGLSAEAQKSGDPASFFLDKDRRGLVFLLEGQLKMYKKYFGKEHKPVMEAAIAEIKALEDALGDTDYWQDLGVLAKEKGVPSAVLAYIEEQEKPCRTKLKALIGTRWTPSSEDGTVPALSLIYQAFPSKDFGQKDSDRGYLLETIGKYAVKVREEPRDLNQLETGIHELRRDLREISLYTVGTAGLIQLSENLNPIPELIPLLSQPVGQSKYLDLPKSDRERFPFHLSKSLYAAITKAIGDLGDIKDEGQNVESLTQAYVAAGEAKTSEEAEAKVRDLLGAGTAEERTKKAQEIWDWLNKYQVLTVLAENLQAGSGRPAKAQYRSDSSRSARA